MINMIEKRTIKGVEVGFDTVKQSYFELPPEETQDKPDFAEMSVEQLMKYAKENNIDIGNATSHTGIMKKFEEAGAL